MKKKPPGREDRKASGEIRIHIWLFLLSLAVVLAFAQTTTFDFVEIDDAKLIHENPVIVDSSIPYSGCFEKQLFSVHYKPLTLLTWKAEYQLFGEHPSHFHLLNWLLHLANTILLFFIGIYLFRRCFSANRATVISAFFLALLFSVHPLRVESVAWASERKDVLFSLFYLSGLLSYIFYVEKKNFRYIIAGSLLFLFSGLSKSMGITLVAVIFLVDFWYHRDLKFQIIREKIPFFIVFFLLIFLYGLFEMDSSSVAFVSSSEILQENPNQISSLEFINQMPYLLQWFFTTSVRFVLWIIHVLLPFKLSILYPHNEIFGFLGKAIFIFPILIALLFFWAFQKRKNHPALLTGLAFFTITLSPALLWLGSGTYIFLSDRFTYIPSIGILFIVVVFVIQWQQKMKGLYFFMMILLFGLYFGITLHYVRAWRKSEDLYKHSLSVSSKTGPIYLNLAKIYFKKGDNNDALEVFNKGIRELPHYAPLYSNRAKIYFAGGYHDLAIADYNKALSLNPKDVESLANRGAAYSAKQEWAKALRDLNKAVDLEPDNKNALASRANMFFDRGQFGKALSDYDQCLSLYPEDAELWTNRGAVYAMQQKFQKALVNWEKALEMDPGNKKALAHAGFILFQMREFEESIRYNERLLKIAPDNHQAMNINGLCYKNLEQYGKAIRAFSRALEWNPENGSYYLNRSASYNLMGDKKNALKDARKAVELGQKVSPEYLNLLQRQGEITK